MTNSKRSAERAVVRAAMRWRNSWVAFFGGEPKDGRLPMLDDKVFNLLRACARLASRAASNRTRT